MFLIQNTENPGKLIRIHCGWGRVETDPLDRPLSSAGEARSQGKLTKSCPEKTLANKEPHLHCTQEARHLASPFQLPFIT